MLGTGDGVVIRTSDSPALKEVTGKWGEVDSKHQIKSKRILESTKYYNKTDLDVVLYGVS